MSRLISPMFLGLMSLGLLPLAAPAADEGRFSYLEQEVRNLQRQVMSLSRRLDQLDSRPARIVPGARAPAPARDAGSIDWVDSAKWRSLKPGMSELEVVGLLGAPTSMREIDGSRVLFYAMEIGTGGFLSGSVRFRERAVIEVQQPALQ